MNTELDRWADLDRGLKLFSGELSNNEDDLIYQQLPLLKELTNHFELATGWQLDFTESNLSFKTRKNTGDFEPVTGQLKINDLSEQLPAGSSARHRGYCDRLVDAIDAMINTIQQDRQRFRKAGVHLNPVVQPPFQWWAMAGNTGVCHGNVANWSISNAEKIQLFSARVAGEDSHDQALAAAALLATFETASLTSGNIFDYASILPQIVRKVSGFEQRLSQFGTFELDPITGEYEVDGFDAHRGYAIIDLGASAVIQPDQNETEGLLVAGQILAVGIDQRNREAISGAIKGTELTIDHGLRIIEKELGETPALFLYRK